MILIGHPKKTLFLMYQKMIQMTEALAFDVVTELSILIQVTCDYHAFQLIPFLEMGLIDSHISFEGFV
jgi:hypothetical protein